MTDAELNARLAKTVYAVEASSFEQHSFWQNFHLYPTQFGEQRGFWGRAYSWEQQNPGCLETVGYYTKRPVCISLFWNVIDGQWVMFWEPTSELVDHRLIDKWFDKHFTREWEGRRAMCNADNFNHCIHLIDALNAVSVT